MAAVTLLIRGLRCWPLILVKGSLLGAEDLVLMLFEMLVESAEVGVQRGNGGVHNGVQIIFLVDELLRILAEYSVNNLLVKNRNSRYLSLLFPLIMRRCRSLEILTDESMIVLPLKESLLSVHVECAQEFAFMKMSFVFGVIFGSYRCLLFKYFILVIFLFTR